MPHDLDAFSEFYKYRILRDSHYNSDQTKIIKSLDEFKEYSLSTQSDEKNIATDKVVMLSLQSQRGGNMLAIAVSQLIINGLTTHVKCINLRGNQITDEGAIALAAALRTGNYPQDFTLDLSLNHLYAAGFAALADAIASGNCPSGLHLNLELNHYCNDDYNPSVELGIRVFGRALTTGRCPKNLALNFRCSKTTQIDLQSFADALTSGKCPEGLHLGVGGLDSSGNAIPLFAKAFQSGQCPQGLSVVFHQVRNINFLESLKSIKQAIISGYCPKDLELDFDDQFDIRRKFFLYLARIYQSNRYPEGLQLRFNNHNFYGKKLDGVKELLQAINKDNVHNRALLGLGISTLYNQRGLANINKYIQKYQPRSQFTFDFQCYNYSNSFCAGDIEKDKLLDFLENNKLRHLALTYITLSQGARKSNNVLFKLPDDDLLCYIMSFLFEKEQNKKHEPFLLALNKCQFFATKTKTISDVVRNDTQSRCMIM